MAHEPPAEPTPPTGTTPAWQADTGRRNRRTRQYSDGFAALDAHSLAGDPVAAEPPQGGQSPGAASGPPRVRLRPKSDTVVELPQDRAAVALPEVPAHLVVAEQPEPQRRIAAHRSFGHDDSEATRTETRTAAVTAVGPAPVSQRPTAREIATVRAPARWKSVAGLLAAAIAGGLAAWLLFGRSAPPTAPPPAAADAAATVPRPAPPPAPAALQASAQAPVPAKPDPASATPDPELTDLRSPTAPAASVATPPSIAPALAAAPTGPEPAQPARQAPDPSVDPCAGFDRAVAGTAVDPVAPYLALRRAPDETAVKIAELPDGTRLRVLASHGRWRRIAVCKGQTGWVHARWIAPATGGTP